MRPHESALRGYLRNRFPSVDVDEVVQESYLKMLRSHTVGHIASAKAYFFSIARNTALSLFKRRRQLYSDTPLSEVPSWRMVDSNPDAATESDNHDRLALVADAMETLPSRCREIMQLALIDGLNSAQIATRLRLSENTVRVQMARGVRRCYLHLRHRGEAK